MRNVWLLLHLRPNPSIAAPVQLAKMLANLTSSFARRCVCSFISRKFHLDVWICMNLAAIMMKMLQFLLDIKCCSLFAVHYLFLFVFLWQILCLLNVVNCINEITVSGRRFRLSQENLQQKTLKNIAKKINDFEVKTFHFHKGKQTIHFSLQAKCIFWSAKKVIMRINFNEKCFFRKAEKAKILVKGMKIVSITC